MREIFKGIKGVLIEENFPLSKISSIGIGGKIRYLIKIKNKNSLPFVKEIVEKEKMKYVFIGKLTNMLFPEGLLEGMAIQYQEAYFEQLEKDPPIIKVGAGISLTNLILKLQNLSIYGLEPLIGIPGSLGGAIKMNAGAFGVSISDFLSEIEVFSFKEGFKILKKEEVNFGYRYSSFKDEELIVGAILIVKKENQKYLIEEYLKKRNEKFPKGKSLGCVFKNPNNLSAGKLIEKAGLKNFNVGDAVISDKHANFIINRKKARFLDVYELIQIVKERVYKKFGVLLEEEIKIVDI
ncbi:MAG: UDP-N-acetylmuramate dehydrogenase [candidate division WOR-3 bacterium]|nr:UDP-N-acetylmuramate dehydrogenase [candidate division WOR-3 bacterium]MCX7837607.1 UDP-N-acetylmuramate dehydrogenase [candidate division WOR-3 bacterium]MDW8113358.1 UDP-N-acetylmuramate dehydrogenase [candidate division WOR-3 bacterium]